jgi:hypothetical protein
MTTNPSDGEMTRSIRISNDPPTIYIDGEVFVQVDGRTVHRYRIAPADEAKLLALNDPGGADIEIRLLPPNPE